MPVVSNLLKGLLVTLCGWMITLAVVAGDVYTAKKQHQKIVVKLLDELAIEETTYTLGQIAEIQLIGQASSEINDTKVVEQLKEMPIGRTPRVGYVDKVRRTEIEAKIENIFPGLRRQIKWEGSSIVKIRAVGTAYDKDKIIGIASIGLNNWLGGRYSNYAIRPTGDYQDILLPKGDVEVVPRMTGVSFCDE